MGILVMLVRAAQMRAGKVKCLQLSQDWDCGATRELGWVVKAMGARWLS